MSSEPTATNHKFCVVLNKKLESGVALNAASHMAACLVGRVDEATRKEMLFVDYLDADENVHPVSGLSLVVLKAKNSNQIRDARAKALEAGIPFVDFTESMTQGSYVEQMERTHALKETELEYWGLCIFGRKTALDAITGKFSLWT